MLGVSIDGLPAGYELDLQHIQSFLDRRRGGKDAHSTTRAEPDQFRIVSGLIDGATCGAPLCALFENIDTCSADYQQVATIPRPSHVDYYVDEKYFGAQDIRGGGHFSGRMTLPLCFAGAVCLQLLNRWDIHIGAHIEQIHTVLDQPYDPLAVTLDDLQHGGSFPVNDPAVETTMKQVIADAAAEGDSVGGVIECAVIGLPIGVGSPLFAGIENRLSTAIFAVPAVRGIEFGAGFAAAGMLGSEHNDAFCLKEDADTTRHNDLHVNDLHVGELDHKSNNAGGVVGGLSTGMPLIFRVAIKPTSSIAKEQDSVDLDSMQPVKLSIQGRHDPCIVPRAVPCIEAAAAITLADMVVNSHA